MTTFSEIYQRYSVDVFRFALGLSNDPAWASDLTAETFVRALVSPNPIRLPTVKAYLFTITRHLYLHAWRKERRLMTLEDSLADGEAGPEQLAEHREELRAVLAALQELPEVDRAALLMRAGDELPYDVIASALGISLAAAKVKIHRARMKLNRIRRESER